MSYILEALKKSEQQREIGRVPGITSVHEDTAKSNAGRWRWLIFAVLLVNAGLLVLLLWPEADTEPEPTKLSPPDGKPARIERGSSTIVAPVTPGSPPAETPMAGAQQATGRKPSVGLSPPEPEKIDLPPATVVAEPSLAVATAPAQPSRAAQRQTIVAAQTTAEVDQLRQPPQPPQPPVVQPPPPSAPKTVAPALPVWPQIPTHLFQQLNGSLRLDVHVFSVRPQERFVLINMKKYKQGEKLQEGPQLDEITAEGVILSFRGQQFRLQAQ